MKEFRCHICKCYLGEMTQGKIKKDTVILCTECMDRYERYKSVADLANMNRDKMGTKGAKGAGMNDMPDFFKDIFKTGGK